MTNDKNDKIYRTLEFFKTNHKKIHIKIISGRDAGLFRNGFVLDVSLRQRCFVFIDSVLGEVPYLFEEVDGDYIVPYKEKGEGE
ncbi:MAG TPA: hypothetical protein VMZ91_07090 [Candidatus Paceibacterota bacterium]|nr:hypothetical protein [Candidatus Paceibacterota bacterium]